MRESLAISVRPQAQDACFPQSKVFACFQCGSTLKAIYITLRRVRDLALRFLRCLNQHIAEDLQQFRC